LGGHIVALVYDLFINRECEDCAYGMFDVFEEKYWCELKQLFRDPKDKETCPDITTTKEPERE
jgi:hypothetical protein